MPGRRPLAAFAALFTLPLPACLSISAPVTPTREERPKTVARANDTAKAPRTDFAALPRAPGTVVQANPKPELKINPSATAVQKPANPPPTPPGPPSAPVVAVGAEPRHLPPLAPQPEPPLLAAVRAYAENRPERAIEIIRTLPQPNQEFVLALLPALARGASADLNNDPVTAGMLVDQLDSARARLESRAALRVENVTFCKDVAGFGRFMPQPRNEPYRPNARAQFYLEVKNLGSRASGDLFITHIHAVVEIRDARGQVVEQIGPGDDYRRRVPAVRFDKRLESHSPLHDFHVLYIFSVPAAPGVYEITAELRDAATGRTVKTPPTRFDVAGP
jgi:hypothetical protein